ncbi:MAG: hypothetical protein ACO35F_11055 [Ilumatobacteraceae bacterium]
MTDTMTTTEGKTVFTGDDITDHQCTSQIYSPGDYHIANFMLNRLRTMYSSINTQLNTVRNNYSHDIEVIGNRLISEAEDRGWCDAYDDVIADLNSQLYMELPTRERTFTYRAKYTVYVEVEVESTNENDAEEQARDLIEERLNEVEGLEELDKEWISREG